MPKLAKGRDAYLTPEEIARAALALFDAGGPPFSIRRLARSMGVGTSSLYHYFPADDDVVGAAVALVLREAIDTYLADHPNPFHVETDPVELLVGSGMALRRTFQRHRRLAARLADAPSSDELLASLLALYGAALERLGHEGERAADALGAWGDLVFGAILLSATRRLAAEGRSRPRLPSATERAADSPAVSDETAVALDAVLDLARLDDEEELCRFEGGLRLLVTGIVADGDGYASSSRTRRSTASTGLASPAGIR